MMSGKPKPYPFFAVIVLGIALTAFQFSRNRSLWLDEAMLALNVLDLGFAGLMKPLAYDQAAPIGFLFAEKLFVLLLGGSESALRLFPFLCYLASVPVTFFLALRLTREKAAALLATALFVLTISVIAYASEVKQYMTDVLFAGLIPLLALRHERGNARSLTLLAATGAIAVYFSNAAVIPMTVAGAWLAYDGLLKPMELKRKDFGLLLVFLAWGATFAGYYLAFIAGHPSKGLMLVYWKDAFLPLNPFSGAFYGFILHAMRGVCGQLFGFPYWRLAETVVLCGLADLALSKRFRSLYFLAAPVALHLLMSGLKLYPFTGRFLLYAVPLFTILAAVTTARLCHRIKIAFPNAPEILMLLPVLAMIPPFIGAYPIDKEEIRQELDRLHTERLQRSNPNEPVYVYYSSLPAVLYYKQIGWVDSGTVLIAGEEHRDTLSAYDPQLDSLHGTVWLLFSHVFPFGRADNEEAYMVGHLRARGARMLDSSRVTGSSLYRMEMIPRPGCDARPDSASVPL